MKKQLTNIARAIQDAPLKACVVAAVLTAGSVGSANATMVDTAIANFKSAATNGVSAAIVAAGLGGVISLAIGFMNMKKKSGDRGDDITFGKIIWPIIAGGGLLAISFVALMTVDLAGGSSQNIGQGISMRP
jgi:hypothetical protein